MNYQSGFEIEQSIRANPDLHCPPEILAQQVALRVTYFGFDHQSHEGVIEIHRAAANDVAAFFVEAYKLQFPIEKVAPASHSDFEWDDDKLMAANVSSGFNYRTIAGTQTISLHGRGLAFDINPRQNPYIRYQQDSTKIVAPEGTVWDVNVPGTLYAEHPLVQFMLERGWQWGGNWPKESGRIDYQHFQKESAI